MILSPFDPAELAPVAALIPPRIPEPAVAAQNQFATRLASIGQPGPFTASFSTPGLILNRDGQPFELALPVIEGMADRREAAEITALALNRLCGLAAVEDRLDPAHIAAVHAESARFQEQAGHPAAAAE